MRILGRQSRWLALLIVFVLVASACGGDDGSAQVAPDDESAVAPDDDSDSDDSGSDDSGSDDSGSDDAAAPAVDLIRISNDTDIVTWVPGGEPRNIIMNFYQFVYDGLVNEDASGNTIPGLAAAWDVSADAITFTLREGVTFSDGTPFNAEAAKAALEHTMTEGIPPVAGKLAAVASIDAVDDTTLVLNLGGPAPSLLRNLSRMAGLIVSPSALGDATNPVGTGPWVLDLGNSTPGSNYLFTPNESSWDSASRPVDNVEIVILAAQEQVLNAVVSGELTAGFLEASSAPAALDAGLGLTDQESFHMAMHMIDRNGDIVPELADERVRRAIGMAIDRATFFDVLHAGYGFPSTQRFFEGQVGYDPDIDDLEHDLDAAKALMAEAGVGEFTLQVPAFGPFTVWSEAIGGMLAEVGITLEIVAIDPSEIFSAPASGQYPIGFSPVPDIHPADIWFSRLAPTAFFNPQGHEDADMTEAANAALAASGADADALWGEVMGLAAEKGYLIEVGAFPGVVVHDTEIIADTSLFVLVPGSVHIRSLELAG